MSFRAILVLILLAVVVQCAITDRITDKLTQIEFNTRKAKP